MRWSERIIEAHRYALSKKPSTDRRGALIALWDRHRNGGDPRPTIDLALELIATGKANPQELGFHVLADLALTDPSLRCHLSELTKHRLASVRQGLAFYLSRELLSDFTNAVYRELLRDKAASVRRTTIETVGMYACKDLLPDLRTLRAVERNEQVIQRLDWWIPLLEAGYILEPDTEPGRFTITVLKGGNGISSRSIDITGPNDPRIPEIAEEMRRHP